MLGQMQIDADSKPRGQFEDGSRGRSRVLVVRRHGSEQSGAVSHRLSQQLLDLEAYGISRCVRERDHLDVEKSRETLCCRAYAFDGPHADGGVHIGMSAYGERTVGQRAFKQATSPRLKGRCTQQLAFCSCRLDSIAQRTRPAINNREGSIGMRVRVHKCRQDQQSNKICALRNGFDLGDLPFAQGNVIGTRLFTDRNATQ